MKKTTWYEDSFELKSPHPPYEEVTQAMVNLKNEGWKHLRFEAGTKRIGTSPEVEDYSINARIYGIRIATDDDINQSILFYKNNKKIKEQDISYLLKQKRNFLKENNSKMKSLQKEIVFFDKEIQKLSSKRRI